jgi:DNA-binding transcriptional MerR regulator
MTKEFRTITEIAKELGISKSKLQFYVTRGYITPTASYGKVNVFNEDAIKNFENLIKLSENGATLKDAARTVNGNA